MLIGYLGLAVLAGIGMAAESPSVSALSGHVGTIGSAFVNRIGGMLILAALAVLLGRNGLPGALQAPAWEWLGGVYGAVLIALMAFATKRVGVELCLCAMMLGQVVTGGDHRRLRIPRRFHPTTRFVSSPGIHSSRARRRADLTCVKISDTFA